MELTTCAVTPEQYPTELLFQTPTRTVSVNQRVRFSHVFVAREKEYIPDTVMSLFLLSLYSSKFHDTKEKVVSVVMTEMKILNF